MSNVPKNKSNAAVLVRSGAPDYNFLSSDTQPCPKADEAGAIMVHSDTGNEFKWTGTVWVSTGRTHDANIEEKLAVLHQDNIEIKQLLKALLMGIEIIAGRQNDPLIDDVSED